MKLFIFPLLFLIVSCSQPPVQPVPSFDWQGHRGARGLAPENTIPSFIKAMDLGVTTLELDVVISKDSIVMVSHEPWMNHEIASWPDGRPVTEAESKSLNLFQMTADSIQLFDVGIRGNDRFTEQEKMRAVKPSLFQVFMATESYRLEKKLPLILYNIETKSTPDGDKIYHPDPETFARLVFEQIYWSGFSDRVIVQSFDPRTLEELRKLTTSIPVALLVYEPKTVADHLNSLSFKPEIISPYFKLVTSGFMTEARISNLKVIPWTVNEVSDMRDMIHLGVDGIITDYPDRIGSVGSEQKSGIRNQ